MPATPPTSPTPAGAPTEAPAGVLLGPRRVQIRRVGPALQATLLTAEATILTVDGTSYNVVPGDWAVYQAKSVLTIIRAKAFPAPYELVVPNTLTLTQEERTRLEATAGLGSTESAAALCTAVERLARIEIGGVHIAFTPGQLEELKHRAFKRGRDVEAEIHAVIDRIKDELFWKS